MSAALAVDGSVGVSSLGCSPTLSPLQASRDWAEGAEAEGHKGAPAPPPHTTHSLEESSHSGGEGLDSRWS